MKSKSFTISDRHSSRHGDNINFIADKNAHNFQFESGQTDGRLRRATIANLHESLYAPRVGTSMFYGGRFLGENKLGLDGKLMERRERGRKRREKVVGCCKKVVAFLFSHVGLAGKLYHPSSPQSPQQPCNPKFKLSKTQPYGKERWNVTRWRNFIEKRPIFKQTL